MPNLNNIPGFTELTTERNLPNFPIQADSWNAPEDANSKKTTQPSFTVSGVNVTLDYGHYNTRHVMRGQGGIKGNNKIMTTAFYSSKEAYSGLGNSYQFGMQAHVWTINTSTGELTVSTTNKQHVTGTSSRTSQFYPQVSWFDAPGSGYLMAGLESALDSSNNNLQNATFMRQLDSTFSNLDLALSYDGTTTNGGLHAHTHRNWTQWRSNCVPLTSTDSAGGASYFMQGADSTAVENASPNGAEVSYNLYNGAFYNGQAYDAKGYTTYIQPDAPVCGASDFHSLIGGYGTTSTSYYKAFQCSGDGSRYDTGQYSDNLRYTGQYSHAYQRSGNTHTIYLISNGGYRANEVLPMTSYNTSVRTITAKSWNLPRFGRGLIGQSCVGIGNNEWVSCMKEDSDFIRYYNEEQEGWPLIKWELDDTNGVTIKGAVNIPKLNFGEGSPFVSTNIDQLYNDSVWAFPIWTNANDADPSWLVIVWFYPSYLGDGYQFNQPIVKSYPWPTFKSLNISI
tara:strand:+ start:2215 stop:3738 length:1524 start_codon:yes stop_codon:yes gene_type:complete